LADGSRQRYFQRTDRAAPQRGPGVITMAQFSRTWWGQRFIAALEQFTDPARLGRGRSYASGGRILDYTLVKGTVTARVRGSINPYFGVYKEPIYRTSITIKAISAADWTKAIRHIASRADLVTKLLMNEMPDTIEDAFSGLGLHLLPHSERDFVTDCTCPDWANPCKHIAGVYYLLASALDRDPFVMFELRGLSRDDLHAERVRSPLGQILSSALKSDNHYFMAADLLLAGRQGQLPAPPRAPGLPTMLPHSVVRLRGSECVGVQFERLDWFLSRVSNQ